MSRQTQQFLENKNWNCNFQKSWFYLLLTEKGSNKLTQKKINVTIHNTAGVTVDAYKCPARLPYLAGGRGSPGGSLAGVSAYTAILGSSGFGLFESWIFTSQKYPNGGRSRFKLSTIQASKIFWVLRHLENKLTIIKLNSSWAWGVVKLTFSS